jgi:hypothetical protein
VIWVPYLATVAIMLAVAWLLKRGCRNAARPFDRHTYSQDDVDRLAAECRDSQPGHQNLAWPPGVTAQGQHIRARQRPCGCFLVITPDGAEIIRCPDHDPQFVTEWEGRLSL